MKTRIFLVTLLAVLFMVGNAVAIPTQSSVMNGTFDRTTEWAGYYDEEDTAPGVWHLGPGGGDQAYDVEYLGLYIDTTNVYFALQTGLDVTNDSNEGCDLPGDFALDIDGIGGYDAAISFGGINTSTGDVTYTLWDVSNWQYVVYTPPPPSPDHSASNPWRRDGGTLVPASITGSYGTTTDSEGGGFSHVLEGYFPTDYLTQLGHTWNDDVTIHWTMHCGNDYLNHTSTPVPEPATMLLLGTGLIGMACVGRRKISGR